MVLLVMGLQPPESPGRLGLNCQHISREVKEINHIALVIGTGTRVVQISDYRIAFVVSRCHGRIVCCLTKGSIESCPKKSTVCVRVEPAVCAGLVTQMDKEMVVGCHC